jgi:hypothetical protein
MKIKKGTVLTLSQVLNYLTSQKTDMRFHYKLYKNSQILEPEVKALQTINKSDAKFNEFEKKRLELCQLHAEKDEAGEPKKIIEGQQERFLIADEEAFTAEINKFKDEYTDAIEAEEKRKAEFMSILDEEIELELIKIKEDAIPDNIDMYGFDCTPFFELLMDD